MISLSGMALNYLSVLICGVIFMLCCVRLESAEQTCSFFCCVAPCSVTLQLTSLSGGSSESLQQESRLILYFCAFLQIFLIIAC